jgi:hypothetical protein
MTCYNQQYLIFTNYWYPIFISQVSEWINAYLTKSGVEEFFHLKLVIPAPACAGAGSSGNPEMLFLRSWMPAWREHDGKTPRPLK